MVKIYKSMIRSTIEYAGVAYHSLLTKGQSERLEHLQTRALKTIFGWNCNLAEVADKHGLETLA